MNLEAITDAIVATGAGALACEEGALLVDHWIQEGVCADRKIVAVECGFVMWLDEATAVIGVQDLLTEEQGDVVGNEWKTTGARSEKDWSILREVHEGRERYRAVKRAQLSGRARNVNHRRVNQDHGGVV